MTQDAQVQPWKFWHPLAFWKVMVVMLVAQIVATIPIVALREGAGLPVPEWIIGGVGGVLGYFGVRWLAARQIAKESSGGSPGGQH